jgi:hypothetical protein
MPRVLSGLTLVPMLALTASTALAQPVPQPFPRPQSQTQQTAPPVSPPAPAPPAAPAAARANDVPSEATLGVPLYPNAQFIASYDAGRGQRYYLFGVSSPYADIVAYYRNVLKNRGDVMYEEPPVHIFEIGRFREDTMAFPPSVTVKDYTWGGIPGYLVPLAGGGSQRYPTVIQVVPVSPGDR